MLMIIYIMNTEKNQLEPECVLNTLFQHVPDNAYALKYHPIKNNRRQYCKLSQVHKHSYFEPFFKRARGENTYLK